MKLSDLLTYYRHRDSLSLESVGDFVGVSKSTVKRWSPNPAMFHKPG